MLNENKDSDQLCSYCTADQHFCFRICKKLFFSHIWVSNCFFFFFYSRAIAVLLTFLESVFAINYCVELCIR